MKDEKGKYIDDPEARKKIWETAPRAEDKYGNKLILIGKWWFSYDFNRLWELAVKEMSEEDHVIVARVSDGRIFSRPRSSVTHSKRHWKRRIESGWYVFLDHSTQQVY